MTEEPIIYNNPLDWIMEQHTGELMTPEKVMEYFQYDIKKATRYLRHWADRHSEECDILDTNPLTIKVMLMPHDIRVYNRNVINNKRKARRIRR